MLRLNFRSTNGDSPTLMLAPCVRFCADGTLRGPDNYVIAHCQEGRWQVGGRLHRELECEGPVRLRLTLKERDTPQLLGPFLQVRTAAGVLYGDDSCLGIAMPGRGVQGGRLYHQITLAFEGGSRGQV